MAIREMKVKSLLYRLKNYYSYYVCAVVMSDQRTALITYKQIRPRYSMKRNYHTLRLQLELISMSRPACSAPPHVDVQFNSIVQARECGISGFVFVGRIG